MFVPDYIVENKKEPVHRRHCSLNTELSTEQSLQCEPAVLAAFWSSIKSTITRFFDDLNIFKTLRNHSINLKLFNFYPGSAVPAAFVKDIILRKHSTFHLSA